MQNLLHTGQVSAVKRATPRILMLAFPMYQHTLIHILGPYSRRKVAFCQESASSDQLPHILGDFGAFMVDAHHPPRNSEIVVYDRPAAPLELSTMIDASFSW